ncbi:MAG: NUDIX domain-containing protein [Labilithrix sp.]|nr:NUDIX domain-containing protein [Labilithrix sp.]MCW5813727.1 NUDIX domain-containing protein [Labilithrix sp.]
MSVTNAEPDGFLTLRRYDLVLVDGPKRSEPFRYDTVDRHALDAAVMVAHSVGEDGEVEVYLRSAVRPPIALRPGGGSPALWELPAGLIEPGEEPRAAAAREVAEELGFDVGAEQMEPLGEWSYPAPGFVGEIHHFFHVRVDPRARREPDGDGSALEAVAIVIKVPLREALEACRTGGVRDEKTELALRRLADVLR